MDFGGSYRAETGMGQEVREDGAAVGLAAAVADLAAVGLAGSEAGSAAGAGRAGDGEFGAAHFACG